jgi:hypothetical protein
MGGLYDAATLRALVVMTKSLSICISTFYRCGEEKLTCRKAACHVCEKAPSLRGCFFQTSNRIVEPSCPSRNPPFDGPLPPPGAQHIEFSLFAELLYTAPQRQSRCKLKVLMMRTCLRSDLGPKRWGNKSEAREIRTPNLLIWSQTRCRCAIAPLQILTSHSLVQPKPSKISVS